MPDDQNKPLDLAQGKPSTIDDLVKELSKNNSMSQAPPLSVGWNEPKVNQGPPPNLPGVKIDKVEPKSPVLPPQPPQPPPILGQTKPSSSVSPPKPQTTPPLPATPLKPSPAQEYKSSIRTMGEDIASLKSGQKPSGVDIPRKVTPEIPKTPMPGVPKLETPPLSTGPISAVGLGRAERTGPLPFTPALKGPEMPKPPVIQPPIVIPQEKKGFLGPMFYILIAGALVVGGVLYWYFVLRIPAPEVVLSPTPTPILTPTPVIKNLGDVFKGAPVNFEIAVSVNFSIGQSFKAFVSTLSIANNEFSKINLLENIEGALVPLNFLDVFGMDLIAYPPALKDNVVDSIIGVYGQSEIFNKDGGRDFIAKSLKKTAFVARIKDEVAVQSAMKSWEITIAKDLADYLLIPDTSKETNASFLDNTYRGVPIRYMNFPFPDITVDYAMVEAAGQSYLVIAGSRESIYAAIDVLLEQ